MASKEELITALRDIAYPGFTKDIVSFGLVQNIEISDGLISIKLLGKSKDDPIGKKIELDVKEHLTKNFSDYKINVTSEYQQTPQPNTPSQKEKPVYLPTVKYKIAVASGKGGVGKSTVAVNLAVALSKEGMSVGLLDADIYGPSIPLMLGVTERPYYDGKKIHPIEKNGLQLMSLGFLIEGNDAVVWRGPLVARALQQLMDDVVWPELDIMVFDMPPGTGDAQLTISQSVALDGAVIVSTPQDVALLDAVKGVKMFRKVNVPILGIIENMSYFICPKCGERTEIFSYGGVKKECGKLNAELLGEIPIDADIRIGSDNGAPIVADKPSSPQSKAFREIARNIKNQLIK